MAGIFALAASMAFAQDAATKHVFWAEVAPITDSLYCGLPVETLRQDGTYSIEHVYPRDWMKQTLGCSGDCSLPEYRAFESDMHNLWPAKNALNSARGNRAFANLAPSDQWRGGECDFRSRGTEVPGPISGIEGLVEPSDAVKGDVARAILYVHRTYGGLLPNGENELMQAWSVLDPVSDNECLREAVIEKLQGTRNPYVHGCDNLNE